MNPRLQAKLATGIRKLQGLVGEPVTVGNVPLTVIVGDEMIVQEETAQGLRDVGVALRLSIALGDVLARPALGATVLARGRTWHIKQVDPTQTTWEVTVQSPNK